LEIQHEKGLEFHQKNPSLYFFGEEVRIVYKELK
jgi:hypothetical protein